jgi:hypothetical protein
MAPLHGTGLATLFLFVFFGVFAIVVIGMVVKVLQGLGRWTSAAAQPLQQVAAQIVAKRTEVSGGEHSTSTAYYATFEMAGGVRREFEISGPQYGLLAERDRGLLSCQGAAFHGFVRQPDPALPPPVPPPGPPPSRVCAYCGGVLPPGSNKCASCGWRWQPAAPPQQEGA